MIVYEATTKNEDLTTLPKDQICAHLWKTKLPAGASEGAHLIKVRTVDMHGRVFEGSRIVQVTSEKPASESEVQVLVQ